MDFVREKGADMTISRLPIVITPDSLGVWMLLLILQFCKMKSEIKQNGCYGKGTWFVEQEQSQLATLKGKQ